MDVGRKLDASLLEIGWKLVDEFRGVLGRREMGKGIGEREKREEGGVECGSILSPYKAAAAAVVGNAVTKCNHSNLLVPLIQMKRNHPSMLKD